MHKPFKYLARWVALTVLGVLGLAVYLAYGYRPPEEIRPANFPFQVTLQIVETERYRFNTVRLGQGKPLVLIHGAGTWLYSYRHSFPVLAKTHAVHVFDMPGHGFTTALQAPSRYDLPYMSAAILEYLDYHKLSKVSLVGHSFGGGWALYFAQRYPERVEKLVLLAPRALDTPYKREWQMMKYPMIGELFSKFFSKNDIRRGLEDAYFHKYEVTEDAVDNTYIPLTLPENRRAQYRLVRDSDWRLTTSGMRGMRVPTLILWGEKDQYLPVEQLTELKARMPNVRAQVLDQCGHALQEECADRVNRIVAEFLASAE